MRRILALLILLAAIGFGIFWLVTAPKTVDAAQIDALAAQPVDMAAAEQIFHAGGCAACHAAQDGTMSGGMAFDSPFGTFYAPNITPSAAGIEGWSAYDLANAMQRGTAPDGAHYYPAFPYASYIKADPADIVALHGYLQNLAPSDTPSKAHDVGFPFNIRRSLGGWKFLFLNDDWVIDGDDLTPQEMRGRYLAEALNHCAECHTPRNALGAMDRSRWMGGAPNPSGEGNVPNITPAALDWSADDIAEYLSSGFTPEFDSVGGHMAAVVEETAQMSAEDRAAIAAYIKRLPPVE